MFHYTKFLFSISLKPKQNERIISDSPHISTFFLVLFRMQGWCGGGVQRRAVQCSNTLQKCEHLGCSRRGLKIVGEGFDPLYPYPTLPPLEFIVYKISQGCLPNHCSYYRSTIKPVDLVEASGVAIMTVELNELF